MSHDPNPADPESSGLGGSLKALAALCIVALAVVGVLVVLEVIPRSVFVETTGKVLAVGGIVAVAALALALLARR